MQLYIKTKTPPPTKNELSKPYERHEWSDYFEAITSWFCKSNALRSERSVLIEIKNQMILMSGPQLRYLAPSYRSIGSLISKAYTLVSSKQPQKFIESTPGIMVNSNVVNINITHSFDLQNLSHQKTTFDPSSVISLHPQNQSYKIPVLASNYTQAIVWFNRLMEENKRFNNEG